MRTCLGKLHVCWLQLVLVFLYLLHYPFFLAFSRRPQWYGLLNLVRKSISRAFMNLSGIFFDIRYEEPLDRRGTYVFCPNHTSYLDIPLMCLVANGSYFFMGKGELIRNPLFRLFFKTIDVPVRRESKVDSYRAFKRSARRLRKGSSLVLFPEGTIPDHPPGLGTFKNGAFRLAIEAGVPVVPVSMLNTWKILYDKGQRHGSRPGIIRIFVHRPIPTTGLSAADDERLKERVYEIISSKLSENAR